MTDPVSEIQAAPLQPDGGHAAPLRPAASLHWLVADLAVICTPLKFYREGLHGLSMSRAILLAAVNVAVTVALSMVPLVADERSFRHMPEMLYVPAIWLGISAVAWLALMVGSMLLVPAISGVETINQAWRRSIRLITTTTAVYPVMALGALAITYSRPALHDLFRSAANYWVFELLYSLPFIAGFCWPFVLMFVGVLCDRRRTAFPRRLGQQRCDLCGYLLVVIPEERVCPECGRPVEHSERPELKVVPRAEREAIGGVSVSDVVATWWQAWVLPATFWQGSRIRCDNRAARNGVVRVLLLAAVFCGLASFALTAVITMPAWVALLDPGRYAAEDYNMMADSPGTKLWSLGETFLIMAPLTAIGVFLANQMILMLAISVSAVRSNTLRHDELTRIGYYAIALPACLEIALVFLFPIVIVTVNLLPNAYQVYVGPVTCLGLVGLLAGLAAWSLASAVRGMQAARYSRF